MADVLGAAAVWLAGRMKGFASVAGTYRRGEQFVALTATYGSSLLKTSDVSGRVKIERTARDIILTAADLDFGVGPVLPLKGDTWEAGGQVFEVTAPGNEPHYRFADPYRVLFRIHLKYVGVT